MEEVLARRGKPDSTAPVQDSTLKKAEEAADEQSSALELSFFIDALGKYYELSLISRSLKSVYGKAYFKNRILSYGEDHLMLVARNDEDNAGIFGLEDYQVLEFQRRLSRWDDINDGIASFAPSVLLGIVASYESLFADLYKRILLLRPERYDSSDRR